MVRAISYSQTLRNTGLYNWRSASASELIRPAKQSQTFYRTTAYNATRGIPKTILSVCQTRGS